MLPWPPLQILAVINSAQTRGIAKTRQVDLQGAFVKIGDFLLHLKGFLVEFLENRRS